MQHALHDDNLDYNNPDSIDYDNQDFNISEDAQQNYSFEEANELELNQQFVDPVFEDQEIEAIDFAADASSSRGFGLRGKILLLLVFLLTTSLATSMIGTLLRVNTVHFEELHENRIHAAEAIERHAEDFFVEKVGQLLVLGSTQVVQNSVAERNLSYAENYASYDLILGEINTRAEQWSTATEDDALVTSIVTNDQSVNAASNQLTNFAAAYGEHSEISITDQHGATVAASSRLADYYHGDQAWWQAAWANGQGEVYISELQHDEATGTTGFLVGLPIFSNTGDLLGVMRSRVDVNDLVDYVAEPRFGETGHVVLMDNSATALIDPGQSLGQNANNIVLESRQALIASSGKTMELTDENGDQSVFTTLDINASTFFDNAVAVSLNDAGLREYGSIADAMNYLRTQSLGQSIRDLNWTLVIRQKYNDTAQIVQNAIRWNLIIFIITLLTTLFIGVIFARRLTKPLNHLVQVMRQVGAGDLSSLAEVNTKDEIGVLAHSVNDTVVTLREVVQTENERDVAQEERAMLQGSISNFLDVITDVAQGDLTRRGAVSADILGNVVDATNVMVEEVGFLLTNVKQTATEVGQGAQNMILSSESIAQSNQSRVQTANQLAEAVQSVSLSMQQMAQQVDTAATTALQTYSASQEGSLVVKDTLVGMQSIRQEVQTIAKRIKNLGDRSLEISEIVETIRHLASQTNLLALNAAIEAAGAGEAGGRFAIVADEVRKLAEDSAQATERVSSLIQSVQEEVQDVVISVEDGIREVEGGYELATQAGQRLDDIGQQAQTSAGLAQRISELVKEQVQRVGIVNNNLQMMSSSGTESQHVVAEGKQIAEQLQILSQELLESLSHFRLEEAH